MENPKEIIVLKPSDSLRSIDVGMPFAMSDVYNEVDEIRARTAEFQKELVSSVYGVKAYINSIRENFKTLKMRPGAAAAIKASNAKKKEEIE